MESFSAFEDDVDGSFTVRLLVDSLCVFVSVGAEKNFFNPHEDVKWHFKGAVSPKIILRKGRMITKSSLTISNSGLVFLDNQTNDIYICTGIAIETKSQTIIVSPGCSKSIAEIVF